MNRATLSVPNGRVQLGFALAALAIVVSVGAALVSSATVGRLTGGVESLAFASGAWLKDIASGLPLRYYAFGAGMLAAVNPCGFALLPAFLGFYLGDTRSSGNGRHVAGTVVRAAWVSVVVTLGFVVLFGVVAGIILGVLSSVSRLFPLIGLIVGLVLIVAGGRMVAGRPLYFGAAERVAGRLGAGARRTNSLGYLVYGVAYGAASLGCTLPIFMTVVGSSMSVGDVRSTVLQFVLYALGMGVVISALTVSVAFVKNAVILRTRQVLRYVEPLSAVLLLLAGAYVVYYWLTLGGLLAALS